MTTRITVLLADDHALVRDVLADRLNREDDIRVVAVVDNAETAIAAAIEHRPTIILMDIDMPGLTCFEAARTIQQRCAGPAIIFLSAYFHDQYVEQALAVRAAGYVTKNEPLDTVVRAIRSVAGGGSYFSPEVQARIVVEATGTRLAQRKQSRAATLTQRELEVLRYIARGMSQKEIAQVLHLSVKTIHRHGANLMEKLDIHDRVELTRFAIREGLAEA